MEAELAVGQSPDDGVSEDVLSKGALRERTQATLELAESVNEPVAAILFTLDQLGDINRMFGRMLGDRCLQEVAIAINRIAGPSDLVGRYRGGEIVLIRMNATVSDAQALFGNFQEALEEISTTLAMPVHALLSMTFLEAGKPSALEVGIEEARASAAGVGISVEGKR